MVFCHSISRRRSRRRRRSVQFRKLNVNEQCMRAGLCPAARLLRTQPIATVRSLVVVVHAFARKEGKKEKSGKRFGKCRSRRDQQFHSHFSPARFSSDISSVLRFSRETPGRMNGCYAGLHALLPLSVELFRPQSLVHRGSEI